MKREDALGCGAVGLAAAAAATGAWMWQRRHSISFEGRTVVITGGSRGLGLHMARRFAAEGAILVLVARREQELRDAADDVLAHGAADVMPIVADVGVCDEAQTAIDLAVEQLGRIDVLVNNAGIIQVGPMEHMDLADFEQSLDVHVWGPLYMSLAAIEYMKRQGEGRIVNISSIGGRVAVPHLLPYCVGKFALTGLSDGLRMELRPHNIFVTTVCPWLMRTGSPPQALFKGQHEREYAWFSAGNAIPLLSVSAPRAAAKIVEACRRGDARLTLGIQAKVATLLNQLSPEALTLFNRAFARVLMPGPAEDWSTEDHLGWESRGHAPSIIQRLIDRDAARANQYPPLQPAG